MMPSDALYAELKPDISAVAEQLFELSQVFLRKRGNFLPHAVVIADDGKIKLFACAPENDRTNSTEVLPLLHAGLRQHANEVPLKAIGVAENVTVTLEGQHPTKAIKVLFEHVRGLTVALYMPFEKPLLRGYTFGNTFALAARPEINAWPSSAA